MKRTIPRILQFRDFKTPFHIQPHLKHRCERSIYSSFQQKLRFCSVAHSPLEKTWNSWPRFRGETFRIPYKPEQSKKFRVNLKAISICIMSWCGSICGVDVIQRNGPFLAIIKLHSGASNRYRFKIIGHELLPKRHFIPTLVCHPPPWGWRRRWRLVSNLDIKLKAVYMKRFQNFSYNISTKVSAKKRSMHFKSNNAFYCLQS